MAKTERPTAQDALDARRIVLEGLAHGDDGHDIATRLNALHPNNDTFPGEVLLELGADALDAAGASRHQPLAYGGLWERFLPECEFRGRNNRKLQYALLSVGALRGGIELDLLDEVTWWQTDDFWHYALYACVAWIRATANRNGVTPAEVCAQLATQHHHVE